MPNKLLIYNTLTRQQEIFTPLHPPSVGMYVCGPTVYGPPHLGHARSAVNFDVIQRYLKHLGYQVRYIRNITDVGHLERDADEGPDKIIKQAQLENLEPMEVVQRYTNSYRRDLFLLNVQPPSIEPQASGHITEQIAMIQHIMAAGLAYEANGSVYFDIHAYQKNHHYGILSGRNLEDLLIGTRTLLGKAEKRTPLDFALWKRASPNHIMRWPSPWGEGFPGWHIECTAIAAKYLGRSFDIHGGGLDLLFPHHECELAQSQAAQNTTLAKYWLHNNLIMIDDQKMSKSSGNFIALEQLFQGNHPLLDQPYSPMALRFFILQAHYRSTLSFSNQALQAAQNGYLKLINGLKTIKELEYSATSINPPQEAIIQQINQHSEACYQAMNDDFNTARVIAELFGLLKLIHALKSYQLPIDALGLTNFEYLKHTYTLFTEGILGLVEEQPIDAKQLRALTVQLYHQAKKQKQYEQVDMIRAELKKLGIVLQDTPQGITWGYDHKKPQ
jgi:cysteinyl-tRNA synthetase